MLYFMKLSTRKDKNIEKSKSYLKLCNKYSSEQTGMRGPWTIQMQNDL